MFLKPIIDFRSMNYIKYMKIYKPESYEVTY